MRALRRRTKVGLAGGALALGLIAASTAELASAGGPSAPAAAGAKADNWTTYHREQTRQGYDPMAATASGTLTSAWQRTLDGAVYAEPLVVNKTIIAVTEHDSIYGLSMAGAVLWHRNVGTPVPLSELPCGNINPLGITGTPAYDAGTGLVYFAAELDNPIRHRLFAVDPTDGHLAWSKNLDPPSMVVAPTQERGALAIAGGRVWVPFGGLFGDCGSYHGWVIGNALDGSGKASVYQQPSAREAGIWAPSGPAVDAAGNLYVAVGNGAATAPPYDDSDSVTELHGNTKVSLFAPTNWASENAQDLDLGSTGPVLFSAIGSKWVFADGKAGDGYLLHQGDLGGIGGSAASISGCFSWSGMAFHDGVIYVPCSSGLSAYQVSKGPTLTRLWQNTASQYGASPVIGGGAVWTISNGSLIQTDPANGSTVASIGVGSTPTFATPTLHGSTVLVGTTTGIVAVSTQ